MTEDQLKTLPNLFKKSADYVDYRLFQQLIFKLAEKKFLSDKIIDFLNSYLKDANEEILLNSKLNHMPLFILNMLLNYYYGYDKVNLKNCERASQEINNFLSNLSNSLDYVEREFHTSLYFLRKLLYSNNRIMNLEARDICQKFKIELGLALLIKLCCEGLKSDDQQNIKNLILVIGKSGHGKSTSINYLYGVKYKTKYSRTLARRYLLPKSKNNIPSPARVGLGIESETLFPKIINIENFSFVIFLDLMIAGQITTKYALHSLYL